MKKLYLYNQQNEFDQGIIRTKIKDIEIVKKPSFEIIELDGVNVFYIQNLTDLNNLKLQAKWFRDFNKSILILNKQIDLQFISFEFLGFRIYQEEIKLDLLVFEIDNLFNTDLFLNNQENLKHLIVGRILDYILHDLNNPLTSVSLTIQLVTEMLNLEIENRDEVQVKGFLSGITEQLDKASEISKNVVKFGNMIHSDKELFIILDVLNHVLSLIKPVIRKQQLDFSYTQIDSLAFAHMDDFAFILLLILFIYVFYLPKKSKLELVIEKSQIIFKSEKPILTLNQFLENSEIPPCYFVHIFNNLKLANHFEFQIENANLCFSFENIPT